MACLSKLRRTLEPSLQRGWRHRADGWFVSKKCRSSSRKQRIRSAALFGYHRRLTDISYKRWIDDTLVKAANSKQSKYVNPYCFEISFSYYHLCMRVGNVFNHVCLFV